MGASTDGILLIDKAEGESSYHVVKKIKPALNVPRVGHAGTLDPFATGLLIILLGQGTKLSRFIMAGRKVYLATMRLGVESDTLDATGKVTRRRKVPHFSHSILREAARDFVGEIEQVPPAYSAVRYRGRRAYRMARQGIRLELEGRKVTVYSLDILSSRLPEVTARIVCSSGTYVRSLAADFGNRLGCGAHVSALRRLASGAFQVQSGYSSAKISGCQNREALRERIIPLVDAVPDMRSVKVEDELAKRVRRGYQPQCEDLPVIGKQKLSEEQYIKLINNGALLAVLEVEKDGEGGYGRLEIKRVFSE
jgi:tRNA pseudouridine55 synthase